MAMTVSKDDVLKKLKRRHSIIDDNQDDVIRDIIDDTISHYLAVVGQLSVEVKVDKVPEKHEFIITDVASKRYVRRGSEGMTVERVDQYQAQYASPVSDFDEYMGILQAEYAPVDDLREGKVTFY